MKNLSAALVAVCLMAVGLGTGTASAQEAFSLTLSAPTHVPIGESATITLSGFAPEPSHLYLYRHYYIDDYQDGAQSHNCGATAQEEDAHPYQGSQIEASQVEGSFSVEKQHDLGVPNNYTLCGYLVSYDDPTIGSSVAETPDAQAKARPIKYHVILREISLEFRKVAGKLVMKGRVTAPDGTAECIIEESYNVRRRLANGYWSRISYGVTKSDGTFRLAGRYTKGWSKGRYRVDLFQRVPTASETGNTCSSAVSNVVRYRGLSTL